ncbi:MAG TPA: GWxTD domain-containing protein [Gemmatimonadaceae bacterium]|nr:GWxTD domain-containing protein [Gemmatimonadaceae bacterium]
MRATRRLFAGYACAVMFAYAPRVLAQGPRGADTLSPGAVAESLAVLRTLEAQVRSNDRDAAAWYRLGMIAWALSDRARAANAPRGLDQTTLASRADVALRRAAQAAPSNPMYRIAVGRLLLTSSVAITRHAASGFFDAALTVARKDTNGAAHAEAAIELGRVEWRRYDTRANRRVLTTPIDIGRSMNMAMQPARASSGLQDVDADAGGAAAGVNPLGSMRDVEELIRNNTQPLPADVAGGAPYAKAEELFREAYAAEPANARAFRSVAMVLVERSRWTELRAFARAHLTKAPWDGLAWMSLGLALHRLSDDGAAAAYDSAMSYLPSRERARIDRLERVLRPSDSLLATRGTEAEQAARKRFYWTFSDPLWSRAGNESRVEYFARVTYAELRWTVEELGVRGVDSDRGDVHVRYGPPDLVVSIGPNAQEDANDVVTFWIYRSGLLFAFSGMPMFATAHTAVDDRAMVAAIKTSMPVRWDNLSAGTVDSMPVQVARFRGGRDSIDVLVAAVPAVDSILASAITSGPVLTSFWLLTGNASVAYYDTARVTTSAMRTWTRRVAPGAYAYRIEAASPTSARAGRTTATILADADAKSGFTRAGFGVSDLLLATSVAQQTAPGARWPAAGATPLVGAIAKGGELTVVWENYDFAQDSGSARYSVSLSIVRERSAGGRIAARVLGALAGAAQIDVRDDRYVVTFNRRVPYSAAFADQISIGLADTPGGTYAVSIEVTDAVSGKKAATKTRMTIQR